MSENRCEIADDGRLLFFCPACETAHGVRFDGPNTWSWNGSKELPTITPSILVRFTTYGPDKLPFSKYDGPMPCEGTEARCHSFVTDGRISFCSDCTHSMAGQTVDLPTWDSI